MDKEQEKWAIFWCDLLSPVIYEEIEPEWAMSPPEGKTPFGGNPIAISGVSAADPGVVTTASNHGYSDGDRIYIDERAD